MGPMTHAPSVSESGNCDPVVRRVAQLHVVCDEVRSDSGRFQRRNDKEHCHVGVQRQPASSASAELGQLGEESNTGRAILSRRHVVQVAATYSDAILAVQGLPPDNVDHQKSADAVSAAPPF